MMKLNNMWNSVKENENNRIIIYNVFGAFVVKGGSLIISLLTLPAYINYFNDQVYLGFWFTILSFLSWFLTFDLGIGNGLRNHLVPALVEKNNRKSNKYVSSAYIIIASIVIFFTIVMLFIFSCLDWNKILNVSSAVVSRKILNITISILFLGTMLQFLLNLITSILYAMQKSAIINLLGLASNILILLYVSFGSTSDLKFNLLSLAVIYAVAVNLPLLVCSICVFSKKHNVSFPRFKYFDKIYAKEIVKLGGLFFCVQIMYMLITATNEFLISLLVDPVKVVEYQVYNRLFSLIGVIFTLAITPIWSAVTKASAEFNYVWVEKLYKRLRKMTLIAVILQFLAIPFIQFFINIWLGGNSIQVNYTYAIIFAIFGSVFVWNGVNSSIANGFGQLKVQSIYFTIGVVVKLPIAFLLVKSLDSWIGVVIANIIAMSLYSIAQPISLNRFFADKIRR
ncbi:lipopolysaccharide biosynthesis protein [Paenibacillus sp. CN-4]|uniref:lipopolysaccharide biosynthesis protein n=1 Tax=Paenibacillus nanchangensis TaxID=3348343 RepID=UPI00397900A6